MLDHQKSYRAKIAIIEEYLTAERKAKNTQTFRAILDAVKQYSEAVKDNINSPNAFDLEYPLNTVELDNDFLAENLSNYPLKGDKEVMDSKRWNFLESILDRALWLIDNNRFTPNPGNNDTAKVDITGIMNMAMHDTRDFERAMRCACCMFAAIDGDRTMKLSINLGPFVEFLPYLTLALMPKDIQELELNCDVKPGSSEYMCFLVNLKHFIDLNPNLRSFSINVPSLFQSLANNLQLRMIEKLSDLGMKDKIDEINCVDIPVRYTGDKHALDEFMKYTRLRDYVHGTQKAKREEQIAQQKATIASLEAKIERQEKAQEANNAGYSPHSIGRP